MSTTTYDTADFSQSPGEGPRGQGRHRHRHHRGGRCGCGPQGWRRAAEAGPDGTGPGPAEGSFRRGFGPGYGAMAGGLHRSDFWPFPVKALAVLAGFAIFPPLGLAGLAWFIWRAKNRHWDWAPGAHYERGSHYERSAHDERGSHDDPAGAGTGNAAFEERRRQVLDQIEAERRKLDEEAKAFAEFRARERRNRDQEAYDRYRADRAKGDETPSA